MEGVCALYGLWAVSSILLYSISLGRGLGRCVNSCFICNELVVQTNLQAQYIQNITMNPNSKLDTVA